MILDSNMLKKAAVACTMIGFPLLVATAAPVLNQFDDAGRLGQLLIRLIPVSIVMLVLMFLALKARNGLRFEPAGRNPWRWGHDLVIPASVSIALVAISFWPMSNWATHLYGGVGDNFNWRWQIWRFSEELRQWNLIPTEFDDVVAPYGVDLRLNDGYLGMYIGGLWNLVLRPTLAYNVTVATAMLLTFWSSRRLSLLISSNRMIALFASLAAASAPVFTIRYYGHLNLSFAFVLFLVAEQSLKLLSRTPPQVLKTAVVVILAFLSSFYIFVISVIVVAVVSLIRLSQSSSKSDIFRTGLRLTTMGAIILSAISPFVIARVQHDRQEAEAGAPASSARTEEYMYYSVDPRLFYLPAFDSPMNPPTFVELRQTLSPNQVESTPFPGYLFIVAVGATVFVASQWTRLIALLWAIFTLLPMGPALIWGAKPDVVPYFPKAIVTSPVGDAISWLPYQFFSLVSGLSALRTPNRFAMALPVIGVVSLALFWRSQSTHKLPAKARLLIPVIMVLLIVPNIRTERPWYQDGYSEAISTVFREIRDDQTGRSVAVGGDNCLKNTNTVNTQIVHRHAMVGCQTFSAAVPWYSGIKEYKSNIGLASIQCDSRVFGLSQTEFQAQVAINRNNLDELAHGLNVGWVLIDKQYMCDDNPSRRLEVLSGLDSNAFKMAEDDRYIIYSID